MQHADSLIWISGATEGIGLGLSRNVPYAGARVINLSRRAHPAIESIHLDLADPSSWAAVAAHFRETLAGFRGKRAIFVQNAHLKGMTGFAGEVPAADYARDLTANMVAPIRLGEAYLRAARRILADLGDAEQAIADQGAPRGRLRVSAAQAHGRLTIVPLLGEFVRAPAAQCAGPDRP